MRKVQVQLRLFYLGLCCFHRGFCSEIRLNIIIQLTLRNGPLLR